MGSIDRLSTAKLSDTPRRTEAAQLLLDEIDAMLGDTRWNWAASTLKGIASVIASTGDCTMGQHRAVENIRAGNQQGKKTGGNWNRRYEGRR